MLRISLSEAQRAALRAHHQSQRSSVAERCSYILLADQGLSPPQIGRRLQRHAHTIRHWLKAYQQAGLAGLADRPPPGRPGHQGAQTWTLLQATLKHRPTYFGYVESGWTVNLLRHHFRQAHAHEVSDSTVRRALKAGAWSFKRAKAVVAPAGPTPAEKKRTSANSSPTSKPSRTPR